MRKAKPVIIFLAIQLAVIIVLSLINPVEKAIIRSKGEIFTFDLPFVSFYIMNNDSVTFEGDIEVLSFDTSEVGADEYYAVIGTDDNGISHISKITAEKPANDSYIKEKHLSEFNISYDIPNELYDEIQSSQTPLVDDKYTVRNEHKFSANVYIHKGKMLVKDFLVDGVKIEEFLNSGETNEQRNN